jgi:hypothetical protein
MDFDSLKNQVSNLTLYDVKAGVRKVQNGELSSLLLLLDRHLMMDSCHESNRNGSQGMPTRLLFRKGR